MEKSLISGNGKGHPKITSTWIFCVIEGIIIVVALFVVIPYIVILERDGVIEAAKLEALMEEIRTRMTGMAVLAIVGIIVVNFLSTNVVRKTSIDVYENGIKGTSSVRGFRLTEFQLTYNQVSSIDIDKGNQLIINAGNDKHWIYAVNAREIRDIIMAQKSKPVVAGSSVVGGNGICSNCKKPLDASSKEAGLCSNCGLRL